MKAGFRTEEIAAVWMQSVFTVHKYKTSIRKKTEAPEAADILVFLDKTLAETEVFRAYKALGEIYKNYIYHTSGYQSFN